MSVLIKGMEMPKDCGHCRFAVDGWCYAYGRTNIDALSTCERTNYCPLVPVPPHGRLIDADAAIANRNSEGNWGYDLFDLPDYLADCPTVIEAEGENNG